MTFFQETKNVYILNYGEFKAGVPNITWRHAHTIEGVEEFDTEGDSHVKFLFFGRGK